MKVHILVTWLCFLEVSKELYDCTYYKNGTFRKTLLRADSLYQFWIRKEQPTNTLQLYVPRQLLCWHLTDFSKVTKLHAILQWSISCQINLKWKRQLLYQTKSVIIIEDLTASFSNILGTRNFYRIFPHTSWCPPRERQGKRGR